MTNEKILTHEQVEGLRSGKSVTLERGAVYRVTETLLIHRDTKIEYQGNLNQALQSPQNIGIPV